MMKPHRIALAAPARAALFTGLLAALALTTATASSLTGTATGAGSAGWRAGATGPCVTGSGARCRRSSRSGGVTRR